MKITIFDSKSATSFIPTNLLVKGVGGLEVCIVNLALELAKRGHDVKVFNNCYSDGIYDGVEYKNFKSYDPDTFSDLFIGCESFPVFINENLNKKIINWTERPQSRDALRFNCSKIIAPSEWHKNFLNDPRVEVIPNGIEQIFFDIKAVRKPHQIFYAGFTGKGGMAILPKIFKSIKERYPDTEMLVCGDGGLWGQDDLKFKEIYKNLENAGINYLGNLSNIMVANLMASSSILINPVGSHHHETFGLVVAQAMATGCIPVSSGEGNLEDLIGKNAFSIYGDINSEDWINSATKHILEIFDDGTFPVYSNWCRNYVKKYTWENAAIKFENL